jgi:hypothetical protein
MSEGIINNNYRQVGVQLLRDAIEKQPILYGLGMGGYDQVITRMLSAARWSMLAVPFYFRVVHPGAFLKNLTYLRQQVVMARAIDAARLTGLGWLAISAYQAAHRDRSRRDPSVAAEPVSDFSDWADEVWRRSRDEYGLTAVRDLATMRILYPASETRFIRLLVTRRAEPIGWAVVLDTALSNHKYFGDMRLGSIASCFGAPSDAVSVVAAAKAFLQSRGVDLIVSNHCHAAWCQAFRQTGFLQGPSNFILAISRDLTKLVESEGVRREDFHFNRGDGDGPMNL